MQTLSLELRTLTKVSFAAVSIFFSSIILFFSDLLVIFNEYLFRGPPAALSAIVSLGVARCQAAPVARGFDALVYRRNDVGGLVCRDVFVLVGYVCSLTELDVFEEEGLFICYLLPCMGLLCQGGVRCLRRGCTAHSEDPYNNN